MKCESYRCTAIRIPAYGEKYCGAPENCRLRALNRELVEALELAHEHLARVSSPDTQWEHPAMKKIRAALAKAKEG